MGESVVLHRPVFRNHREAFVLDSGTPVVSPPCLQWMPEARKARCSTSKKLSHQILWEIG